MDSSTNSANSSQAETLAGKHVRHLDHLIDIQEGTPFTAIPRVLMDAYIEGKVPEAKFKIIACILSHSSKFKIKRAYLVKRFSPKTLVRYLKEIENEGYIRREKRLLPSGGYELIYHTNRVEYWNVNPEQETDSSLGNHRQVDDSSLGNGSLGNRSLGNPLNENKEKEKEETKPMDGWVENHIQPAIRSSKVIDWVKRFENHFRPTDYIDFAENNEWFKQQVSELSLDGMKTFVLWFEANYERHRTQWGLRNREVIFREWKATELTPAQ